MGISFAGVTLYGGPEASSVLNIPQAHSLHHEYSSLAFTIEFVDDVYAAIDHIHKHGRQALIYFVKKAFKKKKNLRLKLSPK